MLAKPSSILRRPFGVDGGGCNIEIVPTDFLAASVPQKAVRE